MNVVRTYGVTEKEGSFSRTDRLCEEISVRGFAILESALATGQVERLNAKLEEVYEKQCDEVGGEKSLERLNDLDIVRCPLAYDSEFMDLALEPAVLEVPKAVLGQNILLLMQNGVINRPERIQAQTGWHRDLNYQHWTSSKPLALSALVCLEDFNFETGGTAFLPSSHKFETFPSEHLVSRAEFVPNAPAGSIIIFDAMTFHRAGINRSNRIRRAINHVIGVPILAQQISIPAMMPQRPADPWAAAYLGYKWSPALGVRQWRQSKLDAM